MQASMVPGLSAEDRGRAMGLSRIDGAVYAVMVGLGEAYFLADAVRLGASATEVALLVGLPLAAGAAGPILALRLLGVLGRRRPVVVGAAAGQALILFLLAALATSGQMTVARLIAIATLYQICAQCAGTAWSSWYGDLVPADVRGRYFALRNRLAYAGTLLGLVIGGLILNELEPARAGAVASGSAVGGNGFALVYLLAGLCRWVSVGLLAASREGRFSGISDRARVGRFLRTQRGTGAWRLILIVGLLYFMVYLASPFFNPYMLQELEFTYVEYMVATAAVVVAKVLALPLWGSAIDRHGAQRTLARGAVALALVPLPWLVAKGLWGVVFCQVLSGAAWSGFEVGNFSLLLELGYRRVRPTLFAAQSVVNGAAQLMGGLIGSALLSGSFGPRYIFAISGALRLAVAALLIWLLPRSTPGRRPIRPAFRITGFRPGTGLAQRPVDEPEP